LQTQVNLSQQENDQIHLGGTKENCYQNTLPDLLILVILNGLKIGNIAIIRQG
jgi:hypothetical protein